MRSKPASGSADTPFTSFDTALVCAASLDSSPLSGMTASTAALTSSMESPLEVLPWLSLSVPPWFESSFADTANEDPPASTGPIELLALLLLPLLLLLEVLSLPLLLLPLLCAIVAAALR